MTFFAGGGPSADQRIFLFLLDAGIFCYVARMT